MSSGIAFPSAERSVVLEVEELAQFAAGLRYDDLPDELPGRLRLMLVDLLGVTFAGMHTPELAALLDSWAAPPGDALVLGTTRRTVPETAAYLSAIAACALELDEGNKHAAGHPAAHVVFAALAASQLTPQAVPGRRFLTAVAAGYEVAARFGRATRRDPRWHTHGHWGATGAACAATLLLGGDRRQVAAAIDSATGLMHVTPWGTVLDGDFTRNLWIAGANQAGLNAARLAIAGLVSNTGTASHSLGTLVGSLDAAALVEGLGERWLTTQGYLKRHSSCSYTHAAVDLVQSLRAADGWRSDEVAAIRVRIHSLAAPLLRRHPETRLAAMFSLPFVVGTAAVSGRVDPAAMTPGSDAFAAAESFSERVEVVVDEALDRHLPERRCTEVTVELRDGSTTQLAQPNPVGDTDHFPLSTAEVLDKLERLLGPEEANVVTELVDSLAISDSVASVLSG